MLQVDWLMVRLRPISVSSGSTEMQFDCTEQSPQPSQTAGLIIDAARRILHQAALAAAALFGGAGLHEHDGRGALHRRGSVSLDGVEFVAMRGLDAGRDVGRRIEHAGFSETR